MCGLPILLASGLALWANVFSSAAGVGNRTRGGIWRVVWGLCGRCGDRYWCGISVGFGGFACVVSWRSFCCSGQHQETRQAKDHPKAAYEAWHTAWRYPFRARRDWQSQAHLHTTLNKSRDEKLEIVGVWPTYPFGKRACIMGEGLCPAAGVGNRTRCCAGSAGAGIPRDVC